MHLKPIDRETMSGRAYRQLRTALMNGLYEPGYRFNTVEVAKAIGTSATPVREAIFRLVAEGALEIQNAQSIRVPHLTPATLIEIQTIRSLLEGEAAAVAALQATTAEIDALTTVNERFVEVLRQQNLEQASNLNRDVHFAVLDMARMPQLRHVVEGMWVRMGGLIRQVNLSVQRKGVVEDHDHFVLINGLRERDPDKARAAIIRDIQAGRMLALNIETPVGYTAPAKPSSPPETQSD